MRYMVEAVYADPLNERIVALRPKPAFLPLFALCEGLRRRTASSGRPCQVALLGALGAIARGAQGSSAAGPRGCSPPAFARALSAMEWDASIPTTPDRAQ